jgi:hypothetical protein
MAAEAPPYPFEEFLSHAEALHRSGRLRNGSFERNIIIVFEYLKPLCATDDEAQYKMGRLMLIMGYIADHIRELDQSDYAVYGSENVGALVGQHVLRAVYEIFNTNDLGKLGHGPTVAEVMRLADQYRESEA